MTTLVMMKCGHNSMAERVYPDGRRVPACITCSCTEIDDNPPDLSNRTARCGYYGKQPYHSECNYDCVRGELCSCERPSSPDLPFFEYLGEGSNCWKVEHYGVQEFDEFYCGCHSWN